MTSMSSGVGSTDAETSPRTGIGETVAVLDGLDEAYGGNYRGGSDYSPYLPLNTSGLVGLMQALADADAQFPGAGGTYTGGSDYSPFLPLNPRGLADADAQFPGAGGTYTGGSDYSPYLPLNPRGLADLAGLADFPHLGKIERALDSDGSEDVLLGLGGHGLEAAARPAVRQQAAVRVVVRAAAAPARRRVTVVALNRRAADLDTVAARRATVLGRAAGKYRGLARAVEVLDRKVAALRTPKLRAAIARGEVPKALREAQRLDFKRRQLARQAVRWAKLHALGSVMQRNATTQAMVTRQIAVAVSKGQPATAAKLSSLWTALGRETAGLRAVRANQQRLWAARTREGAIQRLQARRARAGKAMLSLHLASQRGPLAPAEKIAFKEASAVAQQLDHAIKQAVAGAAPGAPPPQALVVAQARAAAIENGESAELPVGTWLHGLSDASAQFPGAGGTYTGGSDYSPFLPLNPRGLADADAQFPGAGGTYTGGSDYSPFLPLNPRGLAELEGYDLGNVFRDAGRTLRRTARSVGRAARSVANRACRAVSSGAGRAAASATGPYGAAGSAIAAAACGRAGRPRRRRRGEAPPPGLPPPAEGPVATDATKLVVPAAIGAGALLLLLLL